MKYGCSRSVLCLSTGIAASYSSARMCDRPTTPVPSLLFSSQQRVELPEGSSRARVKLMSQIDERVDCMFS